MQSQDIFNLLHNAIEAKYFGKKISQKEMAKRFNIPMRTYQDWRIGNTQPQAARVLIEMLGELEDSEILRVVKKMKELNHG